jgi:hypothetical protein
MADVVATADQEREDGDGVGDVEEDYAGCDHAIINQSCRFCFVFGIIARVSRGIDSRRNWVTLTS